MNNISNKDIIKNEQYRIYANDMNRIRIEIYQAENQQEILEKVTKIITIIDKIDTLPLNDKERTLYQQDIANIYQIAILDEITIATQYANNLKQEIERNLIVRKKRTLLLPIIVGFIICIVLGYILKEQAIMTGYPIIYGSMGGLLSSIFQNNKLNIDYYVKNDLLYFEAAKIVLLSNVMAVIGSLAVKSGIILGIIDNIKNGFYITLLVYVICGYSQTFIPNILKNFESNNSTKYVKKQKNN